MNKQNNRGHGKDKTQNSPSRPFTAVEWGELLLYTVFLFFLFFFWKAQTVYCILCINSNSHYVIYHCTTRVCQSFVHTVHNTFIILKNNSHDTQLWVAKTTFDKIMLRYLIAKKWYRSPGGMFSHFHPKNLIQLL